MSEDPKNGTDPALKGAEDEIRDASSGTPGAAGGATHHEPGHEADDDSMRELLHQALDRESQPQVDVLGRVQRRIREASGGKFYDDGWSTSDSPPVATYLITTLIMLAIAVGLYLVLAPVSGEPELIDTYPSSPVRVVPPRP